MDFATAVSDLPLPAVKQAEGIRAKNFRLGSSAVECLSHGMTGAILNAMGIILGALFGLTRKNPLSATLQNRFRVLLGLGTFFLGLRLVWSGLNGSAWTVSKQLLIAFLSVAIGSLLGKVLLLQKMSNRVGKYAGKIMSVQSEHYKIDGIVVCAGLFCAAPLGFLGAAVEGLNDEYYLLAIKALMDGLAMTGFIKLFGWTAAVSAIPVFLALSTITLACRVYAVPLLQAHGLTQSVEASAGLVVCAVALVIFQVRRVELTNYLPGLIVAPLMTWLLK